jgi:UDP-glucose 4-epimerase
VTRRALVTGGAGFIGRAVAKGLLEEGWAVTVLDDFSSGSRENLSGLDLDIVEGTVQDRAVVERAFRGVDLCLHLAARINVQMSLDDPVATFQPDVMGTLHALEASRSNAAPFLFMSSCMVYAPATSDQGISEDAPVRPASPYAASKLAGEYLTLSYGIGYDHPVTVIRPFNTYGPFQRTDGEGGVVAIFCQRRLEGSAIDVFGDGTQTRDLLYVDDCAEFVIRTSQCERAQGLVLNAGTGRDVQINDLAEIVSGGEVPVRHVGHPHPQAEIQRLLCSPRRAAEVVGWRPGTTLEEGIARTTEWLRSAG